MREREKDRGCACTLVAAFPRSKVPPVDNTSIGKRDEEKILKDTFTVEVMTREPLTSIDD